MKRLMCSKYVWVVEECWPDGTHYIPSGTIWVLKVNEGEYESQSHN